MAFAEINQWADMINESALEQKKWDAACRKADRLADRLKQDEYDSLEVDQINPEDLGIVTPAETSDDAAEVEQFDEPVDFDAYKLDEADYREPISHALDVVGVKASTADLKAQDTAMISVVEMLMKKIDKLETKLNENDTKEDDAKLEDKIRAQPDKDEILTRWKGGYIIVNTKTGESREPTLDEKEQLLTGTDEPDPETVVKAEQFFDMSDVDTPDSAMFESMMAEAVEATADDEIGLTDDDNEALDGMSREDAIEFLNKKLDAAKTDEEREAIQKVLDTYDYDDSPISRTGFAAPTRDTVDMIDYRKLKRLLDAANELVAKRDSEGLTADEEDELNSLVDKMKGLERDTTTISSVDKKTGLAGEYFHGEVPTFNPNRDRRETAADLKRKNREEEKKAREYQRQHPNVPERGKDDWELADDWNNKILSNFFSNAEKNAFYKDMVNGADPQEKAAINYLFGKTNQRDLAAAWGVTHTAVSAMETKCMDAMLEAMVKIGFMTRQQYFRFKAESLTAQKNAFEMLLERFLSAANETTINNFKSEMKKWAAGRRNTKFNPKKKSEED